MPRLFWPLYARRHHQGWRPDEAIWPLLSWSCRIPTHPGIIALIVAVSRLLGSEVAE
jgi:hypothetical protein